MADFFSAQWWRELFPDNSQTGYTFEAGGTSGQLDQQMSQAKKSVAAGSGWVDRWGNIIGPDGKPVIGFGTSGRITLAAETPAGFYDKHTAWDEYEPGQYAFKDLSGLAGPKISAEDRQRNAFAPDLADIALKAAGVKTTGSLADSFQLGAATGVAGGPAARRGGRIMQTSAEEMAVKAALLGGKFK